VIVYQVTGQSADPVAAYEQLHELGW